MPNPAGLLYFGRQRLNTRENDLLTRDEVLARLKCARSTLYILMDSQGFPRPLKIATSNRWLRVEVDNWLNRQAAIRVKGRTV